MYPYKFFTEDFLKPQYFRETIASGSNAKVRLNNLSDDQLSHLIDHFLDFDQMLNIREWAYEKAEQALEDGSFVNAFEDED